MISKMETLDIKKYPWEIEFPGINFYDIQKQIILDDKLMFGIFLGTGVGKTLPTLVLGQGRILVVCPKQQRLDETWQKNSIKFGLEKDITVVSKEEFRRDWDSLDRFNTVIFDEGHNMLGVLPETRQRKKISIPKTSQIFEAALSYIQKHPPDRFYIATATPMSKPMSVWAIAKLFGKNWNFFTFRNTFYFESMMGRRKIWIPRKDDVTRQRLVLAIQKLGYTGTLADFMDVPDQIPIKINIALSADQKQAIKRLEEEEADPQVRRTKLRTIENGVLYGKKIETVSDKEDKMVKDTVLFKSGKLDYILDRAIEFPKLFVFAAYTAQVHMIADFLEKKLDYKVMTVIGKTKNRGTIFEDFEKLDRGVIVVAAQVCEGYRTPSAPCMIFASKSNRFLHFDQGKGRILDGQHLKKNLYIHLVVPGGPDEDCHNSIMSGADFQEKLSPL